MIRFLLFFVGFLWANPLDTLNRYRTLAGLNILSFNTSLSCAAKIHTKYLQNHPFSHYEEKLKTPSLRALYCGYDSKFVIENLSKGEKDYQDSIKDLFSAIYHRLGFLDFNINEVGFDSYNKIYVYEMGNSFIRKGCINGKNIFSGIIGVCGNNKIVSLDAFNLQMKNNPKVVVWPYDGMKNTPTVFYDEIPDPLPGYGVCGYPISISFNPYYFKNIKLISFDLFLNNQKIKSKIVDFKSDVNHLLKKTQFVLFPLDRLEYGREYTVKAKFLINNEIYNFKWKFNTENENNLLKIDSLKASFVLKENTTYFLYFKPLNNNDKISKFNYRYNSNIRFNKIGYKDANTIYLNVSGKGKITIYANNREVNLIVKE